MKRLFVGILIGLFLAGALVVAQGGWAGPQWEYLILYVDGEDNAVTAVPMVGDPGVYTFELLERSGEAITEFYGEDTQGRFWYPFYLKVLGEDGWELTGEMNVGLANIGQIFKREKR